MSTSRTRQLTLTAAQWEELAGVARREVNAIRAQWPEDGKRPWTADARLNACLRVIHAATSPNPPPPPAGDP